MSLEFDVPTTHGGGVYETVLPHDFNPRETDAEARHRLETERRVISDWQQLLTLREDHPRYAKALDAWLESEKQKLIEADVEIDDEMLVEAAILDGILAEVNADREDPPLIQLAEVMLDLREARHELDEIKAYRDIAA